LGFIATVGPVLAQGASDFINIFGGFVQQAIIQASQAEWNKVPSGELACIEGALNEQGTSVENLVQRGVMPTDTRLSKLRSSGRNQPVSGNARTTTTYDDQITRAPSNSQSEGQAAGRSQTECPKLGVTTSTYSADKGELQLYLHAEVGDNARLAEWSEIKSGFLQFGMSYFESLGISVWGEVLVQVNGNWYFSPGTEAYFATFRGEYGAKAVIAHDQIAGNQISLESGSKALRALYVLDSSAEAQVLTQNVPLPNRSSSTISQGQQASPQNQTLLKRNLIELWLVQAGQLTQQRVVSGIYACPIPISSVLEKTIRRADKY
jgi:hypothetical protein